VDADLNADHLAVAELDRFANLMGRRRIPLDIHGLTTEQALARTGEAVAGLVAFAKVAGKPLAIEALDFRRKKAALRELGGRQAHRLSSFAFARFQAMAASRCEREGVELLKVDPRLTSVIGLAKFGGYGIGTHVAAAMAIGRRAMGWGEALRARTASPRLGGVLLARLREIVKGRKAGEHVWKCWQRMSPWLKACLRKGGRLRSAQDGGVRASGRHPRGGDGPSARDGPSGQAPPRLDASRSRRSGGDLGTRS
jgi:IS605 OrfB family transposase